MFHKHYRPNREDTPELPGGRSPRVARRPWETGHLRLGALAGLILWLGLAVAHPPDDVAPSSVTSAPADPAREARLITNTRQITLEGRRAGEGYFNHDGRQMIFQSEREPGNPFFQIYLMDMETGDVRRVSPGHGKTTCGWIHPDGRRVKFASTHEDPAAREKQKAEIALRESGQQRRYAWDYDEHYDLFEYDLQTGALRNLTRTLGYDAEGAYSPDGTLIAFASNRHAYTEPLSEADRKRFERDQAFMMDIYIMDADGGNVRRLTTQRGYDGGVFFSPDGKRLCWRRFSEDGVTAEVFTMNIDGTDQRQLTHLGVMSWAPFYHPSGEYLVFTTNLHGFDNFELFLVDIEGQREPVRVTFTPGFDGLAAFSPDGRSITWTSNRTPGGQSQIFLANWNHAAAQQMLRESPLRKATTRSTDSQTVSADALRAHVATLTAEAMDGRLTGTPGEHLATQYVAEQFERMGLKPAGDNNTWFQEFSFTAGVSVDPSSRLRLEGVQRAQPRLDQDWRPLGFSHTGTFEARPVVFAGYGIIAPAGDGLPGYDSFAQLDVKDKWVMVLRFMPEGISPQMRQHLSRYSSLRYKAMVVRDRGAAGLIVVTGPTAQVRDQLVRVELDAGLSGTSIPAISISDSTADALLAPGGRSLAALQRALDDGSPQPGFELTGLKVAANIEVEKTKRTGRNVLARLPSGSDPESLPKVVVGAHVDHLGHGEGGNSLAREEERGQVHPGADDNASGVAALLEIARTLSASVRAGRLDLKRDILFAAWSGEELGLLGSKHFVDQQSALVTGPNETLRSRLAAKLNLDMVGRLRASLAVHGVGSSTLWPRELERRNVPVGLPLAPSNDSYLPTDTTPFFLAGVPILSFFTGAHEDYHTPRDTPDKLNFQGIADVSRLVALLTRSLATSDQLPDYVAQARPESMVQRAGLRAFLGTIPDYGESPVPGLKLSGVIAGGPAQKAGLRAGDVIVSLAGRKVENVYDYMYALNALRVGEPVEVVIWRDGQQITLSVTPGSRE